MNSLRFIDFNEINSRGGKYKGISRVQDGFCLTFPSKKQIHKYNLAYKKVCEINVRRAYGSICFDESKNCFWTISAAPCNKIYKLDKNFNEIQSFSVFDENSCKITGIDSMSCRSLIICGSFGTAEVNKTSGKADNILCSDKQPTPVCAVAAGYSGIMTGQYRRNMYIISQQTCEGRNVCQFCMPCGYAVEDFAQGMRQGCCCFYILSSNCCHTYILCCRLCSSDACTRKNIAADCNCSKPEHHNNHNGRLPEGCSFENCTAALLCSVACEEKAIAQLLNAESEKIKKILSVSDDPCTILQTNKSVSKTLTSAVMLEQNLYYKLQTVNEMYDTENKPHCR